MYPYLGKSEVKCRENKKSKTREKCLSKAGRRGRVGSASDCRAGGWRFKSRHPTSAETRMWGRWLAAMLALYIGKYVAPEVNLRERISRTPPHSSNKAEPTLALKPRGDVTRSPKQGYQWTHKWTCVQQKFKKKKKCLSNLSRIQ